LLFVSTAFALNLPDYFLRSQVSNRVRASRNIRLGDQDHDHSLEALSVCPDLSALGCGDDRGLDLPAALIGLPACPSGSESAIPVYSNGGLQLAKGEIRGRAPPRLI
jgi:hypothetical protein